MKIKVKLFAVLREKVGDSVVIMDVPKFSTVADVVNELKVKYPMLDPFVDHVMFAVNTEYVQDTYQIKNSDEIALIPPVSGGEL